MFSYTPLFTLLVQKGMTKTQLREAIGIGTGTLIFTFIIFIWFIFSHMNIFYIRIHPLG